MVGTTIPSGQEMMLWLWREIVRPTLLAAIAFAAFDMVVPSANTKEAYLWAVGGIVSGAVAEIPLRWSWRRLGGPLLTAAVRQAWQVGAARLYRVLDRLGL